MEPTSVEVNHLTVHYGKRVALWDLSLSLPKGKLIGLLGPNGAGKSTFIKAVLGLLPCSSGSISLLGSSLQKVRSKLAYVPQKESIDWDFPINVLDLVLMGSFHRLSWWKRPVQRDKDKALALLEQLGLMHVKDRHIRALSGGQQQRAFIARALLQEAELYFLDEPFSGIDQTTETDLLHLFHKLTQEGKTLVIVQHNLSHIEKIYDWVVLLQRQLISCGPTEKAFNEELLKKCYGQHFVIFDEALSLKKDKERGL